MAKKKKLTEEIVLKNVIKHGTKLWERMRDPLDVIDSAAGLSIRARQLDISTQMLAMIDSPAPSHRKKELLESLSLQLDCVNRAGYYLGIT